MKALKLNAQNYEIELECYDKQENPGDGVVIIFKFGDVSGEVCLYKHEMQKIAKWFLKKAQELK